MLTSEGHRDGDLLTYSLAKLRLYYKRATERRARESAAGQLSMMHAFLSALGVVNGAADMFNQNEATLRAVISGSIDKVNKPKQTDGLSAMQRQLVASGARIAHSPLKK